MEWHFYGLSGNQDIHLSLKVNAENRGKWRGLQAKEKKPQICSHETHQVWRPFPCLVFKLNFDAAIVKNGGDGFGFALRDHEAKLRGAGHFVMEVGWIVEAMEAGAVRWGLKVA